MDSPMTYSLVKALHLLGVVLFLGNIIVSALWKAMADRSRRPELIAYGQRLITATDFIFTAPGAVLILVTGHLMAGGHAAVFELTWLRWGWVLFVASGLLWALVLVPVQIQQAKLARRFAVDGEIPENYWRLSQVWMMVGSVVTLLPLLSLGFMVFRPV